MKRIIGWLVAVAAMLLVATVIFAVSGVYDIGADHPHSAPVRWFASLVRDRSIESRAESIDVPPLADPQRIAEGAEHYSEMCAGCHLAPDRHSSEIREGLYPPAPDLTAATPDPAEAFWTIKHGIKDTAMPAWGRTHDDGIIWSIVAFLEAQPGMPADEYLRLTARTASEDHGDDLPMHDESNGKRSKEDS